MNTFDRQIMSAAGKMLHSKSLDSIQVNLGLLCNQKCSHCHVQASPQRTEVMQKKIMQVICETARTIRPRYLDLTGGAPELNPYFMWFVTSLKNDNHNVQVRTNLTVFFETNMEKIPEFFRDLRVSLVASLPCYLEENVNTQRGRKVYEKSIASLRRLNTLGYGTNPDLELTLVYNPSGPFLPPQQATLEEDYKRELFNRFGIRFTRLITIANMPIGRFWESLKKQHKSEEYMLLLKNSFNPYILDKLMCCHQISIGWDGRLYDCDFNLALGLGAHINGFSNNILNCDPEALSQRQIMTGEHCFGCTAGTGSSCEGALV